MPKFAMQKLSTDSEGRLKQSPEPGPLEGKHLQYDSFIRTVTEDEDVYNFKFDSGAGSKVDFIKLIIHFNGDVAVEDYMRLEVVDVDGAIYPAGTVLTDFGPKFYVIPNYTLELGGPFLKMDFQTVFYLVFKYYRADSARTPKYSVRIVYLKNI